MRGKAILITGGTGLLGKSLVQKCKFRHDVTATYYGDYDVANMDHATYFKVDVRDYSGNHEIFEKFKPDVVIHTASIGSPDFAEKNKDLTWQINVEGTKSILSLCEKRGCKFIYISSNGIYDGEHAPYNEDDIANPINYYGMVKLEGEKVTRISGVTSAIVRPILLYGWNHPFERPNIVTMALDKLTKGETMMAYEDVIINPLYVEDCAEGILRIIETDRYETFNFAGKDRTSIYGLLKKVAGVFNLDAASVLPVKQGYFNELVPRPKDTSYVTYKMEKELSLKPSGLDEGLILMKDSEKMKDKISSILIIAPSYYGIDTSIAKAFEKNECESLLLNYKVNSSLHEKIIRRAMSFSPLLNRALHPVLKMLMLSENKKYIVLAEKKKPRFVFVIKGESIFPETLQYIKDKLKIPCISYQWDDPFYSGNQSKGLDDYRRTNFHFGLKHYNHIFAFDKYYVDEIKKKGAVSTSYLPLATDEDLYKKAFLDEDELERFGHDVSFVGMPFDNRIDAFNELHDFNMGVFGDFWDRCGDRVKGDYVKGSASGEKVVKIYTASKIVMNINHPQSMYGVNTRTFDIPACGAFEIMDYKSGIEDLFNLGHEMVCYHNIDELRNLVKYYLDHPEERIKIAEKGCLRARRDHTWNQRVKTILCTLKDNNIINAEH